MGRSVDQGSVTILGLWAGEDWAPIVVDQRGRESKTALDCDFRSRKEGIMQDDVMVEQVPVSAKTVSPGWAGFWTWTRTVLREYSWEMVMGVQKHSRAEFPFHRACCRHLRRFTSLGADIIKFLLCYHILRWAPFAFLWLGELTTTLELCPTSLPYPESRHFPFTPLAFSSPGSGHWRTWLSLGPPAVPFHLRVLAFKSQKKIRV